MDVGHMAGLALAQPSERCSLTAECLGPLQAQPRGASVLIAQTSIPTLPYTHTFPTPQSPSLYLVELLSILSLTLIL
jgi:hypothetical protein